MAEIITALQELGLNEFFAAALLKTSPENGFPARIIAEHKQAYRVKCPQGEFIARVTGKRMFDAKSREDFPAVGDWVLINFIDKESASIQSILPRQSMIIRSFGDKNKMGEKSDMQIIATNIDVGFVIESVDRDYNLNRFERYLVMLKEGGVKAALIINKIDLLTAEEKQQKLAELKDRFPEVDLIVSSSRTEDGLLALINYIKKGKTYCFLGSSGVGKSSLINKLLGNNAIKTGELSISSDRGKHTTTNRQMYFLSSGGIVIDNPGIREVGMTEVKKGLADQFTQIFSLSLNCKFTNCTHVHEPNCAVRSGVESGVVNTETYNNFINLRKQSDYEKKDLLEKNYKKKYLKKS